MRHYIYNSDLRDAAVAQLAAAGDPLRVVSIGDDARQHALLRSAGKVRLGGDFHDADVLLHSLAAADQLAARDALPPILCLAGGEATPALRALARLQSRGYEIVAHQVAAADDGRARETVFVLATRAEGALSALKRAIVFDAHALQTRARAELETYNRHVASDAQIDVGLIDPLHEVEAFPSAEFSQQLHVSEDAEGGYTSSEAVVFDAAALRGRALSIHFDARAMRDWPMRVDALAGTIALPAHVEVLLAHTPNASPGEVRAARQRLEASGALVKTIAAAAPLAGAWSDPFCAAMDTDAMIAAYVGGPRFPVTRGWDWDVLRAAQNMRGHIFALRTSPNKTRYLSTAEDALRAAEGFPIVSRAWLECCGAWGCGAMAPHEFQTLTAYHFDAVDWMNKQRKLRLAAVMTVHTEAIDKNAHEGEAFNAAPLLNLHGRRQEEEAAKRVALTMHAVDWGHEQGIEPTLAFASDWTKLTVRATGPNAQSARWSLAHQPFRPPV